MGDQPKRKTRKSIEAPLRIRLLKILHHRKNREIQRQLFYSDYLTFDYTDVKNKENVIKLPTEEELIAAINQLFTVDETNNENEPKSNQQQQQNRLISLARGAKRKRHF